MLAIILIISIGRLTDHTRSLDPSAGVYWLLVALVAWSLSTSEVRASDIRVSEVYLEYARAGEFEDRNPSRLKHYNLHLGTAPKTATIVVVLDGHGQGSLVLDIIAQIGRTNRSKREGITDFYLLEETALKFPSILHFAQDVQIDGPSTIRLGDVDFELLLYEFSRVDLWPRKLNLIAGVVPTSLDINLKNNVLQTTVIVDPPD